MMIAGASAICLLVAAVAVWGHAVLKAKDQARIREGQRIVARWMRK